MVTASITVHAHWTPTYHVYYNANGSPDAAPVDGNSYTQNTSAPVTSSFVSQTGYAFMGWNTDPNGNGTDYTYPGTIPIGTSNITVYAKWEIHDQDGNVYTKVTIGTQVWMKENLRTTHYRNSDPITFKDSDYSWSMEVWEGYCFDVHSTDASANRKFGAIYNGYAVTEYTRSAARNIAPTGWHVPTTAEWTTLKNYISSNAKSLASKTDWNSSSTPGAPGNNQTSNNSNNFTGYPNGTRHFYGNFNGDVGEACHWWTSTPDPVYDSQIGEFGFDKDGNFISYSEDMGMGYSVRLIHD